MDKIQITDDLLYNLVPKAEILLLNQIPASEELTHRFSKSFEKKMKRLIRDHKKTDFMKSFSKVAIIILVVVSMLLTTIISVEALRTRAFKVIKEIYKELSSISFIVDNDDSDVDFVVKKPKYIPKGFKQIDINELNTMVLVVYEDGTGNQIVYHQAYIMNNKIILDTEDAEIIDIEINGYDGQIISKRGQIQLIWFDEEHYFNISSTIDKEEIIKIAKSLK